MNNKAVNSLGFRKPKWTLVWTVLAIAIVIGLTLGTDWLNESADMQPGMINLLKLLTVFVTLIVWFLWLAFFSGHRFRYIFAFFAMALMALFFYGFRVVFDGDMGFVRFEPRFMQREFIALRAEPNELVANLTASSRTDFNQFLGNDRNGVVRNRVLNANWTENPPKILWKQPIGEGWSGFAAVNGYAITQEQRGQDECVTCYDAESGDLVWIHRCPRRHEDTLAMGKVGPRATPTVLQRRVYAQGATGVLECINGQTGSLIWSVDIPELLGTDLTTKISSQGYEYQFESPEQSRLAWGRSGSPLVYKDMVIATGGVQSDGKFATLIAFDKETGKEIWRSGSKMIAYGSPTIHKLLGRDQITLVAEATAIGFDPDTGDVLWEVSRPGHSGQDANCSQVTRISDNRILLSKAYGLGGELVELEETESGIKPTTVWKNARVLRTKMMSPVILDGYAYSLTDGFLECSSLQSDEDEGRRMWRKRGRFGNGQLLLVGKHLLVHTEYGVLKLVEASPEQYKELGEIKTIKGICWNTLCLFDNMLLLRSELEAACIELKLAVQGAESAPETETESTSSEARDEEADEDNTAKTP